MPRVCTSLRGTATHDARGGGRNWRAYGSLGVVSFSLLIQPIDALHLDTDRIPFVRLYSQAPDRDITAADVARSLAGVWKALEERTERVSPLDISVFGPQAFDVRNVGLIVRASGEASLEISTAVIDRRGRRYAPSVIEAQLQIGAPQPSLIPGRIRPQVAVLRAEERYLDGARDRWPMEGTQVTLSTASLESSELDFRFDTKDGRGSFGTTLMKQRKR